MNALSDFVAQLLGLGLQPRDLTFMQVSLRAVVIFLITLVMVRLSSKRSLAEKTAALKVAPGEYQDFPTNTADALYSGAVQAVSGAIERMRSQLEQEGAEVKCFIAGGAASEIAPHLNGPLELVDNLVLEGVLVLAQSAMSPIG